VVRYLEHRCGRLIREAGRWARSWSCAVRAGGLPAYLVRLDRPGRPA